MARRNKNKDNKPKTYKRESFESTFPDGKFDKFGQVFCSMLMHDSFKSLPKGAQMLYVCMKTQHKSDSNKRYGLKEHEFFFNRSLAKKYGFNDPRQLTKWKNNLIAGGFIAERLNGRHLRTRSVYEFSDAWWKQPQDLN